MGYLLMVFFLATALADAQEDAPRERSRMGENIRTLVRRRIDEQFARQGLREPEPVDILEGGTTATPLKVKDAPTP